MTCFNGHIEREDEKEGSFTIIIFVLFRAKLRPDISNAVSLMKLLPTALDLKMALTENLHYR